jgi:hypothetical protein
LRLVSFFVVPFWVAKLIESGAVCDLEDTEAAEFCVRSLTRFSMTTCG